MPFLLEPLGADFFLRALLGGVLAATICAVAGTWVVLRGNAFLGEAIGHGMLPGVAAAALVGASPVLGAAASATAMSAGISWLGRRGRLSDDTAIGVVFVGMLALGVVLVSGSRSFATDLTAILFGDILAIGTADIALLAVGLMVVAALAAVLRRPFVAATFDDRLASTLGLGTRTARFGMTALITIAVVASYRAVGTLLVVALLVAPPAAALLWARSVARIMLGAAVLGSLSVCCGLLLSWHAGTAAGASVAIVATLLFLGALALRGVRDRLRVPTAPVGVSA
ncbi:iron chelate uptake ABC transporter family permease subunit [Nakamurella sp. YIM 132087]|uniref:Iron chelate uptake ABC transporter family permease subunit n=1 Tax=Nakamurella alba TaxID=2665158 RepID=A0A7K1FQ58_9ACTN|nr:zinc ABC transporter permease AztB [Nakamurella alba]MTD16200.1 iron chelate uptake ABC transporter family permease subunit [Nakamurella alba]